MKLSSSRPLAKKNRAFIEETMGYLKKEFERYVNAENEVPWYYNERATLGFYVSGLIRNNDDVIVLQEFSCDKGKNSQRKGRADLWVKYQNRTYIVEAKQCFSPINTGSGGAAKWARNALKQAICYEAHDNTAILFSLCFEVIYCTASDLDGYAELIEKWRDDVDDNLDFYTVVSLDSNLVKAVNSEAGNFYYPAVAVYGVFA